MSAAPPQVSTGMEPVRRSSEADAYFKILQTIARFPITDPAGNMDAVNMRLIAEGAIQCGAELNRHSGAVEMEKRAEQGNPGGGHEVTEHDAQKPYEQKAAGMIPRPAAGSGGVAQGQSDCGEPDLKFANEQNIKAARKYKARLDFMEAKYGGIDWEADVTAQPTQGGDKGEARWEYSDGSLFRDGVNVFHFRFTETQQALIAELVRDANTAPQPASNAYASRPRDFLAWAVEMFGPVAKLRSERLLRFVEEAIELAHAEGMAPEYIAVMTERVYSRPCGDVPKEIGQAQACLETFAENIGLSSAAEAQTEWERVQSIPREEWTRRHSAKQALGIAMSSTVLKSPCQHAAIIGLDGKWHCQKCGDAIEMAVAHSSTQSGGAAK